MKNLCKIPLNSIGLTADGADIPDPQQLIYYQTGNKNCEVYLPHPKKVIDVTCLDCGSRKGSVIFKKGKKILWVCHDCVIEKPSQKNKIEIQKVFLQSYGVDVEHSNCNLQDCHQEQNRKNIFKEFAQNPNCMMLFAGTNGVGKTYASCAIIHEYLKSGRQNCRFAKAGNLYLEWIKDKQEGNGDLNFIDKYSDYDLLVIDDLSGRTPTEAYLDIFYLMIDNRHGKKLGTLISSNLCSADISKKYGDAIFSRITSGKLCKFDGKDKRVNLAFF